MRRILSPGYTLNVSSIERYKRMTFGGGGTGKTVTCLK